MSLYLVLFLLFCFLCLLYFFPDQTGILSPVSIFSLDLSSHLRLNLTLRRTDVTSECVSEPEGSLLLCLVFLFALGRLCSPSPDMLALLGSSLRRRWKLQSRGADTR